MQTYFHITENYSSTKVINTDTLQYRICACGGSSSTLTRVHQFVKYKAHGCKEVTE